jgi:hypothetical protein
MPENLRLMRRIDEQYTACPFYGSRRMTACLIQQGEAVNRKRVQRLMRLMSLEAIAPKPRITTRGRTKHWAIGPRRRSMGRSGLEDALRVSRAAAGR